MQDAPRGGSQILRYIEASAIPSRLQRQIHACEAAHHDHGINGTLPCLAEQYHRLLRQNARRLDRMLGIRGCPPRPSFTFGGQ